MVTQNFEKNPNAYKAIGYPLGERYKIFIMICFHLIIILLLKDFLEIVWLSIIITILGKKKKHVQ
jgi:hypothetical protein